MSFPARDPENLQTFFGSVMQPNKYLRGASL